MASWWRAAANWRDWHLPTKLAAVTLVPIIFAIVLGAMQIADQVDRADSYRTVDRLVAVNEQLRTLVAALQRERNTATVALATAPVNAELVDEQQSVNTARDGLFRAARRVTFGHELASARYAEASARLDELPDIRGRLAAGELDASAALAQYTEIIDSLLGFDRTTAAEAIDPALAATAGALHDLESATEEVQYQQALLGIGIARGGLSAAQLDALRASQTRLDDRIASFRAVANPAQRQEFARTVTGTGVEVRSNVVNQVAAGMPVPIAALDWNAAAEFTAGQISRVTATLGKQLRDRSAALQDQASDGAGLASVIVLIALVVAIAVMFIVGRHLLRSLSVLRRSALDVAQRRLPDAVERIRHGGDAVEPAVEPVPVRSKDEVGQVARAFEAVHRQALRLATEQAGLRARYSDVFVNLSRRSQGLVQRQLHLLERLERDEEDADQLATLFQLDHLATRMRRNNENLMVLSGSDVGRRSHRPAELADLLRAAVSEIEQYQRVLIQPPPAVLIVGYAVGDLVRLTAELLDNATAFSAPGTQVAIASRRCEDGSVRIEVLDEGIGMSELELAAANAKLADSATIDVSTSRRMGLFVVGRLAGRHGIGIHLYGGRDIAGVRATVTVPAELVTSTVEEAQTAAIPESLGSSGSVATSRNDGAAAPSPAPAGTGDGAVNGATVDPLAGAAPLPRRTRPTNGSSASDITRRLLGDTDPPVTEPAADAGRPAGKGEHLPLPRRTPNPGRTADHAPPADLALPRPPAERGYQPPPGGLFDPGARDGWWVTDDLPGSAGRSVEETTPIFDEMVSAWFRSISADDDKPADGEKAESAEAPTPDDRWRFAADEGFQTAQAVSESEPVSYTPSGLPRRSPQQNLVPGSATGGAPQQAQQPERDAEEVRGRLSSYRDGVSRARGQQHTQDTNGAQPTQENNGASLDLRGSGWRFAADAGWQAAETLSTAVPAEFTSGGLPRRTPRDNLVPGSVDPASGNGNGRRRVDHAEELRGRLDNFQRGLSRGRQSLAVRQSAEAPSQPNRESE